MIRARVIKGRIKPLEPLPEEWHEGQELVVDTLEEMSPSLPADIDTWLQEMNTLTSELNDPHVWQEIEAALALADRQSKAIVRREMGLP